MLSFSQLEIFSLQECGLLYIIGNMRLSGFTMDLYYDDPRNMSISQCKHCHNVGPLSKYATSGPTLGPTEKTLVVH